MRGTAAPLGTELIALVRNRVRANLVMPAFCPCHRERDTPNKLEPLILPTQPPQERVDTHRLDGTISLR
jgi:hypothetical protein